MVDLRVMKRFQDNDLGVLHNNLLESQYDMSEKQFKLFFALVTLIKKDDKEFFEYQIDANTLQDILNIKEKKQIFPTLFTISMNLAKKTLYTRDTETGKFKIVTIFSSLWLDNGILYAKFNEDAKPFLLNLKDHFTKFRLGEFKPFKSKYSIRIYQLLKQYWKIGERTFNINDLRDMIGLKSNELKDFRDFKRNVIEPAKKELENTIMAFDWETVKQGRGGKVTEITFKLKHKYQEYQAVENQDTQNKGPENQLRPPILNQQLQSEEVNEELKELVSLLPESERTRNAQNILNKYLKAYKFEYIAKQIEYINNQNPKNYFAYLTKAIENDYANSEKADLEKKRIQEAIERELENAKEEIEHDVLVRIDNEKVKIYEEYMNLLTENEKQDLLEEYLQKAKEKYPDIDEKSFYMEFKIQQLITEDIIAKNEIYQKRLSKVEENAKEKAQKEFERMKYSILVKYGLVTPK